VSKVDKIRETEAVRAPVGATCVSFYDSNPSLSDFQPFLKRPGLEVQCPLTAGKLLQL
jgi:phage tail protein X